MNLSIVDPKDDRVYENKIGTPMSNLAEPLHCALQLKSEFNIERHFLTILFADVVNYSRLVEIDDLKTVLHLERLRSGVIRPMAERHGASIVRSFGGDGLVISFADPVHAVLCAIDLQKQVRAKEMSWSVDDTVRFRIGIAMGPILLVNGNLHGVAINVAARLQSLAAPEEIWVAKPVVRQVHHAPSIVFEPLGRLQLRNIKESVEAYRVSA
ncbi:MAG: adenylate/guanylate cyclase domain-containing protein [Pseudomonadota bacterium]